MPHQHAAAHLGVSVVTGVQPVGQVLGRDRRHVGEADVLTGALLLVDPLLALDAGLRRLGARQENGPRTTPRPRATARAALTDPHELDRLFEVPTRLSARYQAFLRFLSKLHRCGIADTEVSYSWHSWT